MNGFGNGNRIYPVPAGNGEFPNGFLLKFTEYCVRSHRPAYVIFQMEVTEMSMAALPLRWPRQPVLLYRRGAAMAAYFSLLLRHGAAAPDIQP